MKAGIFFTGSGPIVVLTSYASLTAPNFVEKLAAKGISKFIAYEVDLEEVKKKYGKHIEVILKDLHQTDDLRVLDYDGHRVFRNFKLGQLGQPISHEPYHPSLFPSQRSGRNEASMIETHNDVIREKHLPRVGDTVRSKKYGTSWRVIGKREIWLNASDDPPTGDYRAIPAIYLCYWRVQEGQQPGIGKMLGYPYSLHDNTFETNWEVVH
jgi:hypothetical protein